MEYTSLFQGLLDREAREHPFNPVESGSTSSIQGASLCKGPLFNVHTQAKTVLAKVQQLENLSTKFRMAKQINNVLIGQLLSEAGDHIQRFDYSALKNQQKVYYSNVLTLLDQRLQCISDKLEAKATKWRPLPAATATLLTLPDQNSTVQLEGKSSEVPIGTQLMENALYPALSVIDCSHQANAQSVTQTLNEVHQLYKHMSATIHRDGERLFELCETIDMTSGFMGTANDLVKRTYVMSKRYHRYIVMVLLLILALVIVRGVSRRI